MPRTQSRPDRQVLLEVCVETVEDAVAAVAAGADRIELNCALALDGLTPAPGLLAETRRAVRVPLITMARPRPGDFCYSQSDLRVLAGDIEHALEHGADGIAFGVLTDNRHIDIRRCRPLVRQIQSGRGHAVFHRAFDRVSGLLEALEQLIDLGVHRVMTSGGQPTALAGMAVIARLIERAGSRIEILPAGGIRPDNIQRIIATTGCTQVHTSLRDRGGRLNLRSLSALVRRLQP